MDEKLKVQIEKLIIENNFQKAFKSLENVNIASDVRIELSILNSRYIDLERKSRTGTIQLNDVNVELNQIRKSLFQILNYLTESNKTKLIPLFIGKNEKILSSKGHLALVNINELKRFPFPIYNFTIRNLSSLSIVINNVRVERHFDIIRRHSAGPPEPKLIKAIDFWDIVIPEKIETYKPRFPILLPPYSVVGIDIRFSYELPNERNMHPIEKRLEFDINVVFMTDNGDEVSTSRLQL